MLLHGRKKLRPLRGDGSATRRAEICLRRSMSVGRINLGVLLVWLKAPELNKQCAT